MKVFRKRHYIENRESYQASAKEFRLSGKKAESDKKSYLKNREIRLAQAREYNKTHYDAAKKAAQVRSWRKRNPDKTKLQKYRRRGALVGSFSKAEWVVIVEKQRGRCAICGETRKLTVDHIVPVSKGGVNYAWNLQGLCRPCNSRKHAKLGSPGEAIPLYAVA